MAIGRTREITIQVRLIEGRDIEVEVARAVGIARAFPGIAEVQPYTKEESTRLIEPWLGTGLADDLPVPRLIIVRIAPGAAPNLPQLRQPHKRSSRARPRRSPCVRWIGCAPWFTAVIGGSRSSCLCYCDRTFGGVRNARRCDDQSSDR